MRRGGPICYALVSWLLLQGCALHANATDPVDAGTADATSAASGACRMQCELAAGACAQRSFESFGALESARTEFQARCDAEAMWAFEAVCQQGAIVLRSGNGYTSEGRFYDPDSGAFLGLTTTTDVVAPPCDGKSFWPELVPCAAPVVTRVLCGTAFEKGDPAGRGVTQ